MITKKGLIAHDLREAITAGEYAAGSVLPPIPELMTRYDVARDTVRDAIALLANEGLVIPRRGIGTVVRETETVSLDVTPQAPSRTWLQQTAGAGRDEVTQTGWEQADSDVAAVLRIPPGSRVVHRTRQFTLGHGIAQISDQWVPEEIVEAIRSATGGDLSDLQNRPDADRNLFQLMADAGHPPTSTTENIGCRAPDPTERDLMEIPPGVGVLITRRVTTEANGKPLELTIAVGAGDRMSATFTVELHY